MQPKAYVPGVAVLLAALLAGCTSSDEDGTPDNRPDGTSTTATAAQPGRYRTLPEPCGVVPADSLDALLPGIKQLTDEEQRETAYEGEPTQTFDTDRRVGCRWKVESTDATDYLDVDFERVVSYENAVSDDSEAEQVYTTKELDADLPEPSPTATDGSGAEDGGEDGDAADGDATPSESPSESGSPDASGSPGPSASSSSGTAGTPAALQPRTLDDLGDAAFLDDELSTAQQRTVTVVFRTSNVIVTVEYVEQPASVREVPDSKEMQDRALNLAGRLAEAFEE
ncbi:DUF3558 domain-containing protein [Streptomyces phyllanthi]|uniref:DUF3558 domain-containing protein n=1 Tax=Streptomyces phyllanthi TaxID=1803180 RepID=A0A5N8WC94_9ACTN|nr:DUF3558 domain-containing protein [Streptomyces phyllanthi]MPY44929.1 DUF3558 domain-containing protein [Streptomyces phyllanthi]